MGYSIIPKLPRNRYNYVGPAYTETTTLSASFKVPGGGTGGGSITNTTFSAMSQIAQQYVDEKGFLTPSDVKTVNGYSIVGSGDIEVTAEGVVDLSAYVTKVELEQAGYLTTVPSNYATKTYVATKAQEIISSGSYITSNDVSNMGYVTTSVLSQASYVTANALETKLQSYVTKQELGTTLGSYVTSTMLEEGLTKYVEKNTFDAAMENVVSTSTDETTLTTYTASQNTGIIVLKHANTTLNLPTTGIVNGKTVTVINKTGGSFTIHTSGNFIDKETTQRDPQTRVVSTYAMQFVYYDGEWYIMQ